MKARELIVTALALLGAASATRLLAAPVTGSDAVGLAGEWLGTSAAAPATRRAAASSGDGRRRARMRPSGAPSGTVRTCSIAGTNLFHLVAIDGGGFVTVAADDAMQPVIGFSTSGGFPDENPANPFWALVGVDAEAAIAGRRRGDSTGRGQPRASNYSFEETAVAVASAARGDASEAKAGTNPIQGDSGIDDLRVAPLVQSEWNQLKVGAKNVYNYYTPSNYYCGCVATAMAQLMRFHKFPTSAMTPRTFTCYVDEESNPVDLSMKGGTYDWNDMPLVPTSSITDTQREAIGRICYDAGVAMRMWYAKNGSATYAAFAHDPLRSVFGYANAQSYAVDYSDSISVADVQSAILANIDAGYPTLLSIWGSSAGGHAILADGYGYSEGTLYCHLNMGWGGSEDYWYAVPAVPTYSYRFTALNAVVYNVFPDKTGELVTGRVIDPSGEPVEGATVTATIAYRKSGRNRTSTTNAVTSASGHFAVFAPSGVSSTVSLSASHGACVSTNSTTATTSPSSSPFSLDWVSGGYSHSITGLFIGNSWGNDLYLANTNSPASFTILMGW